MSSLVSPTIIEKIVGVKRHGQEHYGRADSASETMYVLHSQRCLDSGIDLRECRFSIAMDSGIEPQVWDDLQDRPVVLGVEHGCLVPLVGTEPEPECDHRHQTDTAPFDEPYPVWICVDCGSRCEP